MNRLFSKLTIISVVFYLAFTKQVRANFSWVDIGVNGLTCSACSRSVEMSIRKLGFVQDVQMNLENTEGRITFKRGIKVEVNKIAQAVFDAGFSVRYLKAEFDFTNVTITGNCFSFEEIRYQFLNLRDIKGKEAKGKIIIQFIGKKFISKKEWKKYKKELKKECGTDKDEVLYMIML